MKKVIFRNIAIVSAIFTVSFSVMLIANYFQIKDVNPLQTEVAETLKQLNDGNANNPMLQEQIRQLDLLARKAYFVSFNRLMTGVYILLGMLAVFFVCTHFYFSGNKDVPDKDIDPIDEWAVKTKARKYVIGGALGLAATALVFVALSSKSLTPNSSPLERGESVITKAEENQTTETDLFPDTSSQNLSPDPSPQESGESAVSETQETAATETPEVSTVEKVARPVVSKVTHNAFRGNNSDGISLAKGVPVKWDLNGGVNIAWKRDIPRKGYNSPLINGNRVFFTGADEHTRELYCYDLTTGDKLWSLVAANIPGSPERLPETAEDTGLAASSAATNGKQVCAIFATGDLICADMDGKKLWAKNLGIPDNHYGYAASLLTFGDLLIIQYDNQKSARVIALDIATGAERWSKSRPDKISWCSPVITYINNAPQLVLMGTPSITAYNPGNGEQLWRVECLTGEVGASACSANGVVYGASEYSRLIAINAADGSVLWENIDFLPEVSSPVATKDNIYMATGYGMAISFDTQTGTVRKEHELGEGFYSSPIIADGKVFLFNTDGKVHIFSADDEFRLLDSFETGEQTFATPAFTDGKIVVRTNKSIYCVMLISASSK